MSQVQSFANQLGWMITTKDNLIELSRALQDIKVSHGQIMNNLRSVNYVNEGYVDLASMTKSVDDQVDLLVKHILDEHLGYIEEQSKIIAQTLQTFQTQK
jgi:hypothetical protein